MAGSASLMSDGLGEAQPSPPQREKWPSYSTSYIFCSPLRAELGRVPSYQSLLHAQALKYGLFVMKRGEVPLMAP
jgi:hypothetical protein